MDNDLSYCPLCNNSKSNLNWDTRLKSVLEKNQHAREQASNKYTNILDCTSLLSIAAIRFGALRSRGASHWRVPNCCVQITPPCGHQFRCQV